MSFRARLTSFFLVIVVVPMAAMGFLVFDVIHDSESGKAQARISGLASVAASVYTRSSRKAGLDARTLARTLGRTPRSELPSRAAGLASRTAVARLKVVVGADTVADAGSGAAVAPGVAVVRSPGGSKLTVTLSELIASSYASQLTGHGVGVIVRQGRRTLSSTLPGTAPRALPTTGRFRVGNHEYQELTLSLRGFGPKPVRVTVASDLRATAGSLGTDRLLAIGFIAAFVALAIVLSLLANRALQRQLSDLLAGARRLARGDFSSPVATHGHDGFALLGAEFNTMSRQLATRLDELKREQTRVRRSIRHIGEAFAANLDREALMQLALRTAMDATGADRGRVTGRLLGDEPLTELFRLGRLQGLDGPVGDAERNAEDGDGLGQAWTKEISFASVALGEVAPGGPAYGLITVGRPGRSFNEDDLELLRSLAGRATAALSNVSMHFDVQRQAVTDDLTGLATHGRFQRLLSDEMEEVRRYGYPVGLVMLDIDDFKSINDQYGHQQGDVVLRYVAQAVRENSRDVDVPARYGGEEVALILPHTDLDGTYAIGERIREAIEALRMPLLDGDDQLGITASVGVAASAEGRKDDLIAAADAALYMAKHEGKNRTVKAGTQAADALPGR
jgi:diguanylate cyclase (GGDEF)-like protein